mmetsp:Transcript_3386/g.13082  ORF Transcript_3386/g.13082 Transcript_3386/m.13082 type:complete len:90 (+) Transcript_3386:1678-1947(+)
MTLACEESARTSFLYAGPYSSSSTARRPHTRGAASRVALRGPPRRPDTADSPTSSSSAPGVTASLQIFQLDSIWVDPDDVRAAPRVFYD